MDRCIAHVNGDPSAGVPVYDITYRLLNQPSKHVNICIHRQARANSRRIHVYEDMVAVNDDMVSLSATVERVRQLTIASDISLNDLVTAFRGAIV